MKLNAKIAYTTGSTQPNVPALGGASLHTRIAASSPVAVARNRLAPATSSGVLHPGQSIPSVCATTCVAGITVKHCGHFLAAITSPRSNRTNVTQSSAKREARPADNLTSTGLSASIKPSERDTMTAKMRRAAKDLAANVRRYSPRIRKKLAKSGKKVEPAVVYTAAKYYKALEKLAKE
jgi:hypothetical protein